jgi:peptide/nickel transport system substrate-binding protein
MLPRPAGQWGMPEEMVASLTGYSSDYAGRLKQAQAIMQKLGYSPAKPIKMKLPTRNLPTYRDPAVILLEQLKKIYIEAELEIVDTPQWYAKVARKDYTVGFNLTGVSVDDPDANLVENYSCKSERNYTQYCNAEVDKLLVAQSREADQDKRRKIVWDIERMLVDDAARPIISHGVSGNCWHAYVKGYTAHANSIYNNTRFEDTWLDK